MSPEERAVIIEVLCGQALADHLGDVRDEEDHLWELLGAEEIPKDHPAYYEESVWRQTRARLEHNNLPLPPHLDYPEEDVEDDEAPNSPGGTTTDPPTTQADV